MTAPNVTNLRWRKSSRSGSNGASCVEVASTLRVVRDSKNPTGPVLAVPVDALLRTLKASGTATI